MSGHPFEFIFGSPDPEQQAEMQRAHDQAHMAEQSLRHQVTSFVDDLDEEGVRILRALIQAASGDEGYGSFVQGSLTMLLHTKFGICSACGKNHDKELLGDTSAAPEPSMKETDDGQLYLDRTEMDDGTVQPAMDLPSPAEEAAAVADNMIQWNMRFPQDGEVEALPTEKPVICNGCGMLYQSLEDRMLRPPGIDGCHGCQIKSAHG